eukprot:5767154-Pyramimonas_sp.AAC.2
MPNWDERFGWPEGRRRPGAGARTSMGVRPHSPATLVTAGCATSSLEPRGWCAMMARPLRLHTPTSLRCARTGWSSSWTAAGLMRHAARMCST